MAVGNGTAASPAMDEQLYSRQLYLLGHEAMQAMQTSTVMVVGVGGVGMEIAKNVILAGVKAVILLDDTLVSDADLSAGYYFKESDVGRVRRAQAAYQHLASLNRYVHVEVRQGPFDASMTKSMGLSVLVWAVPSPNEKQTVEVNAMCISAGVKFIQADVFGVCGMVFVDNGDRFVVRDRDGEPPLEGMVSAITNEPHAVVTCYDETRHGLSSGDFVAFEEVEGMTEVNSTTPKKVEVLGPYTFSIDQDTTTYGVYKNGGRFRQVKFPLEVTARRLGECLEHPSIAPVDFGKIEVATQVHLLHRALSAFGRPPRADTWTDADAIVDLIKARYKDANIDASMLRRLARCAAHCIAPIAAAIGGIAAQEVLKSCSGKFTPLDQQLYFDCVEILPADDIDVSEFSLGDVDRRYTSQVAIVGRTIHNLIVSTNAFIVGAGAIGCEVLKNWAMMGVGSGQDGHITVTDMDTIERSNLNRQFLFRDKDVGQLKSSAAAAAVRAMNPHIKVVSHSNRVGGETEDIYDDNFWTSLTVVCTALDNVDARLYVDQRCVYYQKPLMESGTMGAKGNTQIVVPHLTESYGATRDPPEKSIPICTLKNFPSQIEHTIQWARDLFEGLFKSCVDSTNQYLSEGSDFLKNLRREQPNGELETLRTIRSYLALERPMTFDDCIMWARLLFEREFNHNIRQLLHTFPADSTTATGAPFWSGPKRAPSPVEFDPADPVHMSFVEAAANLRAFNYGLSGSAYTADRYMAVMRDMMIAEFQPKKNVRIAANDEELKSMSAADADEDPDAACETIVRELPSPSTLAGYRLTPAEFEKDDDTNFHMHFVTACSNLRARNYRIKEASLHDTRRIAGKIIPAIATTTGLVSGLICLELFKLLQQKPLEAYRNCFANLALPLFSFAEPVAPLVKEAAVGEDGSQVMKWTQWDRIEIDIGDCTLKQLIDHISKRFSCDLDMLSFGPSMLFAFFHGAAVRQARLSMPLTKLIEQVAKVSVSPKQQYISLEACLTNANGEEVDIPSLRVKLF
ncbi:Ubiquitin-like 1-activating enzyme E1A [Plasmodiophora brassicae]|uniref:E1 ubiquitin-activating enzyme n=1 Tax=Plasmodiophora brassicae TaxID=37360 RepID=A0A3P3YIG9_PLABS|nr:unnamed protein product [Plasmodiophora brassicae]